MITDLTAIRDRLIAIFDDLDLSADITRRADLLNSVRKLNKVHSYNDQLVELVKSYDEVSSQNRLVLDKISEFLKTVEYDLAHVGETAFNSEQQDRLFDEAKLVQNTVVDDHVYQLIKDRIGNHTNWRYPGLIVNPRSKRWIDLMVSCDPLYLSRESTIETIPTLDSLISTYPEIYQRRLRLYTHQDRKFASLPQEQFGTVMVWDFFNFLSLNKIEQYMAEIFKLLRPGGVVVFSYTNVDDLDSTILVDQFTASYNSRVHMTAMAERIGYEIIQFEDQSNDNTIFKTISWGEFKKPGTLKTNKAHQVLAEIMAK